MLGSPAFMTALWITTAKPAKTKEPAAAGQDGIGSRVRRQAHPETVPSHSGRRGFGEEEGVIRAVYIS